MSSDSRPSFRAYSKDKFKQIFKTNLTSSIRERVNSNDIVNDIREKSKNFTENAKDFLEVDKIKNYTKQLIPNAMKQDDNSTVAKGFYDSLFSPQTENDVYFKVIIICLWVIAMLCIISTIITMFISMRSNKTKTFGVRMIFLHIFICEFCYLIYILLSMINVALDFKMNRFWCFTANYGVYITVPITYIVLFILSIERLTKIFNCTASWTKILTNVCVTQVFLGLMWAIGIIAFLIITVLIIIMQPAEYAEQTLKKKPGKLRNLMSSAINKVFSLDKCSVDGQISSIFQIFFIILFIILLVLLIKTIVVSSMYLSFIPSCSGRNKRKKKSNDFTITLVFILILLLNSIFSIPYYYISAVNNVAEITNKIMPKIFQKEREPHPMKLKITFILRLISILLQSMVFLTLETNSWNLLSKLLDYITCGKFDALKVTRSSSRRKPVPTKPSRASNHSKQNGRKLKPKANEESSNNELSLSDQTDDDEDDLFLDREKPKPKPTKKPKVAKKETIDDDDNDVFFVGEKTKPKHTKKPKVIKKSTIDDDDDDVFLDEEKTKPKPTKKPKVTKKDVTDDDDDDDDNDSDEEINAIVAKKLSNSKEKKIIPKLSDKSDETEEDEEEKPKVTKKSTSNSAKTNGVSKEKSTSQRVSSTKTDRSKPSKSNTTKYNPVSSHSSGDDVSLHSVNSDDEVKPVTVTKPGSAPAAQPSVSSTKPPRMNRSHSHPQRHRVTHSAVSRSRKTRTHNHNHTVTVNNRRKSPGNVNNHSEKSKKKDRLSQIYDKSDDV